MIDKVRKVLDDVYFREWAFLTEIMGDGCFLQVAFLDDAGQMQKGRKFYVSPHAVKSEIVQTALFAVLTALEHEAREEFRYRGEAVFGPHHDIDALLGIAQQKRKSLSEGAA